METDSTHPLLREDIYKLSGQELRSKLTEAGIKCRKEDSELELRKIVKALRNIIKNNKTRSDCKRLQDLIESKQYLPEDVLQGNEDLKTLQNFITERDNLYDIAEGEYKDTDTIHNLYEDINDTKVIVTPQSINVEGQETIVHKQEIKMTEQIPLIQAGTFSGLPTENAGDFIEKYQIAAKSNRWTEGTKVNLFPAHLVGVALAWYKHYTRTKENNDWNTLKTAFVEAFTPHAQISNLATILQNKVQERGQPTMNYFLDILTLCRRYDPDISDRQVIEHIIQGLQPDICERVVNLENKSLEQLENNLRKIEVQLEIKNRNKEKYLRVTSRDRDNTYDREYQWRTKSDKEDMQDLRTEVRTLANIVSNLTVRTKDEARSKEEDPYRGASTSRDGGQRSQTHERRSRRDYTPESRRNYTPERRRDYTPERRKDYTPERSRGYTPEGRREQTKERWTRQEEWRRRDYTPEERSRLGERTYSGERRGSYYRDAEDRRGETYRTREKHVSFYQGRGQHDRKNEEYRNKGDRKYCRICNKNNHNLWECNYKVAGSNHKSYVRNDYCTYCRMSNHSTRNCFKLNKIDNQTKNA